MLEFVMKTGRFCTPEEKAFDEEAAYLTHLLSQMGDGETFAKHEETPEQHLERLLDVGAL